MLFGAIAVPALVSAAVLFALVRRSPAFAVDVPNERSLHSRPVPRLGGIGIAAGVAAGFAAGAVPPSLALLLALALAAVSFLDDVRRLPTSVRLAAHIAAAAIIVWYSLSPMHPLEIALLALAVAWITNLYNFMDGSDGLAAGMTIIGFGAYASAAWLAQDLQVALPAAAVAAASAAFLAFNFHPARVFLGDAGSIPLGFLAGALGLIGWRDDVWPLWFPVLVFAPFIGDATLTLARRLSRGERPWQAHRDHYYQRLVRLGFGHRRTAYVGYALMALCAGAALYARGERPLVQWTTVVAASLILAAVAAWIDRRWRRHA